MVPITFARGYKISTARITGVNVNINNQEVSGASPNIINAYVNELLATVKRPALGFEMNLGNSGISGFYDWIDANQVIITQYDGTITRLNYNGAVTLSNS